MLGAVCTNGAVDKAALIREIESGLRPHKACLDAMGFGPPPKPEVELLGLRGTLTPRGAVLTAAMNCLQRTLQTEARCIPKDNAAALRDVVAIVKILCTYPTTETLARTCLEQLKVAQTKLLELQATRTALEQKLAQLEQTTRERERRPAACPTCPPVPPPTPCAPCAAAAADVPVGLPTPVAEPTPGARGVSYGVALGLAAAAGVTAWFGSKLARKKR